MAQISRTIARTLGLNEDLTEAIALSHDLGHTPFGHAGEKALNQKMQDHGGFQHNSHALRIVTELENPYPEFRGLNLTWELRESIAKHGYPDPQEEAELFEPEKAPLLEEQIVDTTDSIAYCNHDLDDGLKSGVLDESKLADLVLWQQAREEVKKEFGSLSSSQKRSQIVRYLINKMVTDLLDTTCKKLEEHNISSVEEVRNHPEPIVAFSSDLSEQKQELQSFLYDEMYCHYRVIRMQERAKRIVRTLFDEFMRCPSLLPDQHQKWMEEAGKARAIADYIAGMTDRYAIEEYQKLMP